MSRDNAIFCGHCGMPIHGKPKSSHEYLHFIESDKDKGCPFAGVTMSAKAWQALEEAYTKAEKFEEAERWKWEQYKRREKEKADRREELRLRREARKAGLAVPKKIPRNERERQRIEEEEKHAAERAEDQRACDILLGKVPKDPMISAEIATQRENERRTAVLREKGLKAKKAYKAESSRKRRNAREEQIVGEN